ncbi:Metalloenzyme, LuxS/M16 peptidase-like protein [Dactylonectria estremocensis]|uniref:Cytochrome b-c1 complex subunit 2, mitochondrial n=1 Tax=Dactylonectria estremocensis TaxID=1079267 RepID=A0A9P9F8K1_9HYPO|nr:Metalloenzyme, LuxS/M16 peptidase-like protein [Dactylonectria estremocensis]
MISRASLARTAQQAARRSCGAQRRTFAAAATSAGSYETSDVTGLKIASRDAHGPTTKLAVVAKAGTRFQPLPGLTVGLEEFAFKNTQRRSALRITRESELLGGQLASSHTREAVVLEASFLREDLPYFAELLAEVVTQTKYTTHELHEEVERVLRLKQSALNTNVPAIALDNAHAVAFHTGLGSSLYPASSTPFQKYLNEDYVASFADVVYSRPNIAVVADGAASDALSKWVGQFFKDVPATPRSGQALKTEASKYFGGEQRTSHTAGNSIVIAFPGSSYNSAKAEIAVLASLIGGESSIKWTPGFSLLSKATAGTSSLSVSTSNLAYSDAGLLAVQLSGPAASVRKGAEETVKVLKSIAAGTVAKEDVSKAIANAKFNALNEAQARQSSILLAGSGLVNGGKAYETASLAQAIDSVTAEKLTTVRSPLVIIPNRNTNTSCRPPRPFSPARPPFLPLETSLCSLMLRSLVFRYRWGSKRQKSLYQQSESSRRGGRDVIFVNVYSRNPLVHDTCPLIHLSRCIEL